MAGMAATGIVSLLSVLSRLTVGGVGSAGLGSVEVDDVVVASPEVVLVGSVGAASVELEEVGDVVRVAAEVAVELEAEAVAMKGGGMMPESGMVGWAATLALQARMFVIFAGRFQPRAVGSSSFSVTGQHMILRSCREGHLRNQWLTQSSLAWGLSRRSWPRAGSFIVVR